MSKVRKVLDKLKFDSYDFNSRKEILIGIDESNKFVIKIQIKKNKNKTRDVKQEYAIIKHLNEKDCQTCPLAYEHGTITKEEIYSKVSEKHILDRLSCDDYEYMIQDYLPSEGGYNLSDIVLTLIEQKN